MKEINHIFYYKILKQKQQAITNMKFLSKQDQEEFHIPLIDIVSLFIIDSDTVAMSSFTGEMANYINKLCDLFLENNDSVKKFNKTELLSLLALANNNKLDSDKNSKIVMALGKKYNREHNNEIIQINLEKLEQICSNI